MSKLVVRALTCRRGSRAVLADVNIDFAAGEVTAIVGPNGSGKTTLLRYLAGLEKQVSGEIEIDGRALATIERGGKARRIAYLPQSASVYWPLLGRDLVALGRLPHGADLTRPLAPSDAAAVARALARVNGTVLADRPIDSLSQGERARLLLARTLATEGDILVADEPVASLDHGYALESWPSCARKPPAAFAWSSPCTISGLRRVSPTGWLWWPEVGWRRTAHRPRPCGPRRSIRFTAWASAV